MVPCRKVLFDHRPSQLLVSHCLSAFSGRHENGGAYPLSFSASMKVMKCSSTFSRSVGTAD